MVLGEAEMAVLVVCCEPVSVVAARGPELPAKPEPDDCPAISATSLRPTSPDIRGPLLFQLIGFRLPTAEAATSEEKEHQ